MSPDSIEPRTLRKYVFDHFFETSSPPSLEEVMSKFGLARAQAFAGFRQLETDHHVLLVPGTQRILMANPYSAVATPFRVTVAERGYYANCAWDTVSLHVMLDRDARVESYCHHCATPIGILLSGGKVVSSMPKEPLIFLSVPVSKWYENLINTCSNNMVYFSSRDHLESWLADNPELKGESLTVEEMAKVCQPLSKGRMEMDWSRPPKEEVMAYWDSMGMTSSFWDF